MENELSALKNLEALANQAVEEREAQRRAEEERRRQLEERWRGLLRIWERLPNDPTIAGVLVDKAKVVDNIFPGTVVSASGPRRIGDEFYFPKLILSVPTRDTTHMNDVSGGGRVWESLYFNLDFKEKISVIHKFGYYSRSGAHHGYVKPNVWSPKEGIGIDRFPLELEAILLRFCNTYKQKAVREEQSYLATRIVRGNHCEYNEELFDYNLVGSGVEYKILYPRI